MVHLWDDVCGCIVSAVFLGTISRGDRMDPSDSELFRQVLPALVQSLEPDKVLGHLLQALTREDIEIIRAQNTRNKQVKKLLDILTRRSRGLELLAKALLLSRVQAFLAFEILKKSTWSEESKHGLFTSKV